MPKISIIQGIFKFKKNKIKNKTREAVIQHSVYSTYSSTHVIILCYSEFHKQLSRPQQTALSYLSH